MKRKHWILAVLVVFIVAACAHLVAHWPQRTFRSWTPPRAPDWTGPLQVNRALQRASMLGGKTMVEPEDAAVDAKGWVYGSCRDGVIRRVDPTGQKTEVFADTKGRPLGIVFDAKGHLIVADALKGLLSIDPKGKVTVLVDTFEGKKMRFVDDLDIDTQGHIYFSDASQLYTFDFDTRPEVMARVPTGRIYMYDPKTRKTELILGKMHFANGVTLTHQGDALLVTETSDYSIRRIALRGSQKGRSTVWAKNLPGFPDNINRSSQGGYWVALTSKRLAHIDRLFHPVAWLKKFVMAMPRFMLPKPVRASVILHLDAKGKITHSLHDPDGSIIPNATSATEHKGHLYLGHIYHHWPGIGKYVLKQKK